MIVVATPQPRSRRPRQPGDPAPVPEKLVQPAVVKLLRSCGGKVYVFGTRRRRSERDHATHQTNGAQDLQALFRPSATHPGTILLVECKTEIGTPSAAQRELEEWCRACGLDYVRGGLPEVMRWLIGTGRLKASSVAHYYTED